MTACRSNLTEYGKFYATSEYAAFPQEHRHAPGKFSFSMIMVEQRAHSFTDPNVSDTVIALPLAASRDCKWSWNMGSGWRRETATPGRLLVLPAHLDSRWEVTGSRRLLALVIPLETMREALGPLLPNRVSDAFRPLAEATWEDPFVNVTMTRLWEGLAGMNVTDRLLVDGILVASLSHLLQRAGTCRDPSACVALPRWRLRRVIEFVDSHLHEEIHLFRLAQVANLSPRHFARAFRRETGQTPHRWLMNHRLERAKHLLATSDLSIIEVANTCGFAGQTHLTKLLKQRLGMTPLRWRNEHKGEPEPV